MLTEYDIDCPYCGERISVLLDTSIEQQEYIEDCQVCCSPIVFDVRLDTINNEFSVSVRREND